MILNKHIVRFHHTETTTTCTIQAEKEASEHDSVGKASRHPIDRPDPVQGRKLALKRALDDGEFWYEDRKKIWEDYFSKSFMFLGDKRFKIAAAKKKAEEEAAKND